MVAEDAIATQKLCIHCMHNTLRKVKLSQSPVTLRLINPIAIQHRAKLLGHKNAKALAVLSYCCFHFKLAVISTCPYLSKVDELLVIWNAPDIRN